MQPRFPNFPGSSLFSVSDFCAASHLPECSLPSLGNWEVASKGYTTEDTFTATHFGTGLAAKKMVWPALKGN